MNPAPAIRPPQERTKIPMSVRFVWILPFVITSQIRQKGIINAVRRKPAIADRRRAKSLVLFSDKTLGKLPRYLNIFLNIKKIIYSVSAIDHSVGSAGFGPTKA